MNQNQIRKGDHVLVNGYAEIHRVLAVLGRYYVLQEIVCDEKTGDIYLSGYYLKIPELQLEEDPKTFQKKTGDTNSPD